MPDATPKLRPFSCRCGAVIEPPEPAKKMFARRLTGDFRLSINWKCAACGRRHFTEFRGRIEDSLINLEK